MSFLLAASSPRTLVALSQAAWNQTEELQDESQEMHFPQKLLYRPLKNNILKNRLEIGKNNGDEIR